MNAINNKITRSLILVICVFVILVSASHDAYAIRVSIKRIVFEGSKKSEILTIINNSNEEQTYRLGWRKYVMDEIKSLQALDEGDNDKGVLWADSMIRYAPRRITVPAGASQQIRFLLRRPSDLQNAEYRSHIWIVTESKPEQFDITSGADNKQAIKLAVQPAISLPIFVRNGEMNASASISEPKISKTNNGLNVNFWLNRSGNSSIYGDFDFVCTDGAQEKVLKQIFGVSVYPEIDKRYLNFNIEFNPEIATSCKNLDIIYRADPDDQILKGKMLAQTSISLN